MMKLTYTPSARPFAILFALLLVARLGLGFAYSAFNPAGEAPDEADHYAYAAYIGREGKLPVGPQMTQAKHPPLYYALAAAVARPTGMDFSFLRSNPDVSLAPGSETPNFFIHTALENWPWQGGALALHLGRLVSVLAGLALVALTYGLGRAIWPARPGVALAAAALVAFLPESLFIGGSVSNDMLAAALSALALYAAVGAGPHPPPHSWRPLSSEARGAAAAASSQSKEVREAPATASSQSKEVSDAATTASSLSREAKETAAAASSQSKEVRDAATTASSPSKEVSGAVATASPRRTEVGVPGTHGAGSWLWALLAGISMGLAFLTKASTAGLWPVVALALWAQDMNASPPSLRGKGAGGVRLRTLARPALAGVVASLLALPWLWRNVRLYGDPLAMSLVRATIDQRQGPLTPADIAWLARGWFFSFFGKFGGAGQLALPGWLYALWGLLLALAVAGGVRLLLLRHDRARMDTAAQPGTPLAGWIVLWGAPLATVLAVLSYSQVALGTDQGRLLFPALAPLALLMAGGLAAWLRHGWTARQVAGWGCGLAAIAVFALIVGIVGPFAPPAAASTTAVTQAAPMQATFGNCLQLTGLHWDGAGANRLTLYWRADAPIGQDLRTVLRLVDKDGQLVWEHKRSPAAGRYSTDRWRPGPVIADAYTLPADALARAAAIQLGVYPFPDGATLPPVTGGAGSVTAAGGQFLILPRSNP
jgi:hypothetical protein